MFTLSFCLGAANPRRIDLASLVAGSALALVALASALPLRTAVSPAQQVMPRGLVVQLHASDASLVALRDRAETVRAQLLGLPGVGAIRLHGLLTTGLDVEYAPARLARLGITPDDLRAAVPAQAHASPGHIAVRLDAAQDGPQAIADRIVHASGQAFRLGDVATVARVDIDPVSVLSRDGHPAVDVEIVPAPGIAAGSLDGLVKARMEGMAAPGVTLK